MDQDILSVRIQLCLLGIGLGSLIAISGALILSSGSSLPVLGTVLLLSMVGIVFGMAGLRQWIRTFHRLAKPMERRRYWLSSVSYIGLSLVVTACVWWYLLTSVFHPAAGPLVRIEDLTATRRNDGTYIYPILIENAGDQPLVNRDVLFYQLISTRPLSSGQEDYVYMSRIGTAFTSASQQKIYLERNGTDMSDDLAPGESVELINSNFYLSQNDIDKFSKGDLVIYNFLIMRYEDPDSLKSGKFFYTEHCTILSVAGGTNCSSHNVSKVRKP